MLGMKLLSALKDPIAWLVVMVGLLFRAAIGHHPYSGAGKPPMYGDYEAQRHWMEITVNLPVKDWYRETKHNNLSYWGLDYPPLSAYQSWLYGKVLEHFEPAAVALGSSHGYVTSYSKSLMRESVLFSDVLVLVPALLACRRVFYGREPPVQGDWMLWGSFIQPALLLIDHGHFQYNTISLGLAAGAAAAVASGRDVLGSILFSLSLNHKQMAVYYAPAFFAHLLGKCLQRPTPLSKVTAIGRLGLAVLATFVIVWAPFLGKRLDAVQLLHRIMPVKRGLYEDYVANFWCTTSLLIKWRSLFSQQALIRLCTASTLIATTPALVKEARMPTARGLLTCMACSAFAFYLFSYQVHEKSILLPLMPVMLLAPEQPVLSRWLPPVACFSMYPLLKKDGLTLAYIAMMMLWGAVCWPEDNQEEEEKEKEQAKATKAQAKPTKAHGRRKGKQRQEGSRLLMLTLGASAVLAVGVHAAGWMLEPPERYPYIFDAMITSLSFVHILGMAAYLQLQFLCRDRVKQRQD